MFQDLLDCSTYYCFGRCSSFSTTVSGNCLSGLHGISGHFSYSTAWLELYCRKSFGSGMLILTLICTRLFTVYSVLKVVDASSIFSGILVENFVFQCFLFLNALRQK
jgi:hypothetical protein